MLSAESEMLLADFGNLDLTNRKIEATPDDKKTTGYHAIIL